MKHISNLFKLSKRHLIVLCVSLIGMAIVWFVSASIMLLLDHDASWAVRIIVFIIALFPAFLSQYGLLLSLKLEDNGTFLTRIFVLLYLVVSTFILFFIFTDILKGLATGFDLIFMAITAGLVVGIIVYTMQTFFLLRAILNNTNKNKERWRTSLR